MKQMLGKQYSVRTSFTEKKYEANFYFTNQLVMAQKINQQKLLETNFYICIVCAEIFASSLCGKDWRLLCVKTAFKDE